jgi:hypothetical protein
MSAKEPRPPSLPACSAPREALTVPMHIDKPVFLQLTILPNFCYSVLCKVNTFCFMKERFAPNSSFLCQMSLNNPKDKTPNTISYSSEPINKYLPIYHCNNHVLRNCFYRFHVHIVLPHFLRHFCVIFSARVCFFDINHF